MTVNEMQARIRALKAEKNVCVLAHSYQGREITEVADFRGDSYQLSVMAAKTDAKTVIMCGVRFMAETVKILSPDKTVYLANPTAGCPMAEQMDREMIEGVKTQFPDYTVVCYINTTADLKTVCDVCVTSSCAVKVCSKIENKNILFIPDCNLGKFVADQLPEKTSSCCRAAVRYMRQSPCATLRRLKRRIRTHCCWCIPNVSRRLRQRLIMSAQLRASWIMRASPPQRNSSSAPRTVSPSTCSTTARRSGFMRCPRRWSVRI